MAGEHPAPRGARVRRLAHRPPVGADSSALLPEVSGRAMGASKGNTRVWGEQGPGKARNNLAEALRRRGEASGTRALLGLVEGLL